MLNPSSESFVIVIVSCKNTGTQVSLVVAEFPIVLGRAPEVLFASPPCYPSCVLVNLCVTLLVPPFVLFSLLVSVTSQIIDSYHGIHAGLEGCCPCQ